MLRRRLHLLCKRHKQTSLQPSPIARFITIFPQKKNRGNWQEWRTPAQSWRRPACGPGPAAQVCRQHSVPRYCCHPDCALTATFASCKALLAAHPPWGAASSAPQAGETSAEARPRAWHPTARVHPSAIVDPRAVLDRDACVGPLCVLGPGAVFFVVTCICACVGQFLCAIMHVRIQKHMHRCTCTQTGPRAQDFA